MALSVRPGGLLLTTGEIDVAISEFSTFGGSDRDNLAKPILDAMQGVVYENDRQVRRLNVEWCDIDGSYSVRYMSPILAGALCDGQEFIWIRIWFHQPRKDLIP